MDADYEALKSKLKEITGHLRNRKSLLDAEIRNYPTPITRCDVQFDHLLEQRAGLSRELNRLKTISAESPLSQDSIELIQRLIGSLEPKS